MSEGTPRRKRKGCGEERQSGRFSTSASCSGGSGGQTNSRPDLLHRLEVRERERNGWSEGVETDRRDESKRLLRMMKESRGGKQKLGAKGCGKKTTH